MKEHYTLEGFDSGKFDIKNLKHNYKVRIQSIHLINPDGKIACGKKQEIMGLKIQYTSEKEKVTCCNCKRTYFY